jgi:hypothetical protein
MSRHISLLQPRIEPALQFVTNLPEELLTPFDVRLGFHSLGREAIHDAHDAAALGGLGNEHLGRVGCRAVTDKNLLFGAPACT